MEKEVKKFDANDAMLSVKERIKDAFVSLIPDEQWNEMVQKEIHKYFELKEQRYDNRSHVSDFTIAVHAELAIEVKSRVKTYLQENFNNVWYENGVPVCNAKVEEMITKNAGKILSDMIGGSISMALNQAGFRVQ